MSEIFSAILFCSQYDVRPTLSSLLSLPYFILPLISILFVFIYSSVLHNRAFRNLYFLTYTSIDFSKYQLSAQFF